MKRQHKPLDWISKNVYFPTQAGALAGKAVGPYLLDFQKDFITGVLSPTGEIKKFGLFYGCRKISKTFLFTAIVWYLMNDKRRKGFEVPITASVYEQGKILYSQFLSQINTKALKKKFKIRKDYFVNKQTDSKLHVTYNSSSSNLGLQSSGAIFDEIGAYRDSENLETIQSGLTLSEKKPLLLLASNPPQNLDHFIIPLIRACEKDQQFIVMKFALPLNEDWQSEDSWIKINPFLQEWKRTRGKRFQNVMDNYRMLYRRALETKSAELSFRRLQLGQSISANQMQYIPIEKIKVVNDFDFKRKDVRWSCGVDLSISHDFSAVVFCAHKEVTDELFVFPFIFLPNTNHRTPLQKRQFQKWAEEDIIIVQDEEILNPNQIFNCITDFLKETKIKLEGLQIDPNLSEQFLSFFQKNFKVAMQKNTATEMTKSIRLLERIGNGGGLKLIGENSCYLWMMQNVVVSHKSKHYVLMDRITPRQNIDAPVATSLALKFLIDNPRRRPIIMAV